MDTQRTCERQLLIVRALEHLIDDAIARAAPGGRSGTAVELYPGETVVPVDPRAVELEGLRRELRRAREELAAQLEIAAEAEEMVEFEAAV
jgi:hypothetical protein